MNLKGINNIGPAGDNGAEVVDGIYIGSLTTATNHNWLLRHNIGAIINLSGVVYETTVPVMNIFMYDTDVECDIMLSYLAKFHQGISGITIARAHGRNVLVHCAAGINRSAALIAFYLIECGYTYNDALQMLHTANNIRKVDCLTNPSFRYLLCARYGFGHTFDKK